MNDGMNQNGMGMNNEQPMNNGMYQQQPVNNGMYQQQPMPAQPMMMPNQKKGIGIGKIIGIVILVIVVLAVVYNVVLVKSLSCESKMEEFGAKITTTYVYKKRFDKPYAVKVAVAADLSKYDEDEGGVSKEELIELLGLDDDDPCEDYGNGCSYTTSNVGDKTSMSITLKGKALEKFMEDQNVDEKDFIDFDQIKENFETDDDTTCK